MQKKIIYIAIAVGMTINVILFVIYAHLKYIDLTVAEAAFKNWQAMLVLFIMALSAHVLIKLAYSNEVSDATPHVGLGAIRKTINSPFFFKWFLVIVSLAGVYVLAFAFFSDIQHMV